ncbi:MAG: strawberry notch C-terminal domain-containing protein [Caulobacteraceae bacterium]
MSLYHQELDGLTLHDFQKKTALNLTDRDGALLSGEDMPPMHTFLNRILALRIADQNTVFTAFEALLSGILDRAAAAGQLDRGLEDIKADEVSVISEEVIRTEVATGAKTSLITFEVRTPREILFSDDALQSVWANDPAAISHVVNDKTGKTSVRG